MTEEPKSWDLEKVADAIDASRPPRVVKAECRRCGRKVGVGYVPHTLGSCRWEELEPCPEHGTTVDPALEVPDRAVLRGIIRI